jgi:hypothetical protein
VWHLEQRDLKVHAKNSRYNSKDGRQKCCGGQEQLELDQLVSEVILQQKHLSLSFYQDSKRTFISLKTEIMKGITCDTPVKMIRANNVLKYQSMNQSLTQYIIQVVYTHITILFKYKTLQHDDDTN